MFLGKLLSDEQNITLNKWKMSQEKQYGVDNIGAIGGAYTYSFTPTALGTIIKVSNAVTKQEIDLTDYESF